MTPIDRLQQADIRRAPLKRGAARGLPARLFPVTRQRQSGMAIGVVIIALLLLVLAGFAATLSSRDTAYSANVERIAKQVLAQSALIRQQIVSCALDYPNGSNGQANAFDLAYPAEPADTHLSETTCPGESGTPNLWSGLDGAYAPTPPSGCNWYYFNDKTRSGVPPLDVQIQCAGADNIAALALAAKQDSGDTTLRTTVASNDTLIFILHQ